MKNSRFLPFLLTARNQLHAVFPRAAEAAESLRQSEIFRRKIAWSGFAFPLPAFVKRAILKAFINENGLRTLVETGTQYGDTPWFFRNHLQEIWTVELSPTLARLARERFRKYPNVHVVEGDSAKELAKIVTKIKTPVLFWLDGHYSAGATARGASDCPIYAELEAIFKGCAERFIILIDDARCFGNDKDYPSVAEVREFVSHARPDARFTVSLDMIQITFQS